MTRIPKRVREEAAMICAIAASSDGLGSTYRAAHDIGASNEAVELAITASLQTQCDWKEYSWREPWAEAEAMLRTGEFP